MRYVREAGRRVFCDPSWWWRSVLLGAITVVPLVGVFIVLGYRMILVRDAAWGVDRGLPKFREYREVLARAWDGFVVSLVWGFVISVPFILGVTIWTMAHLGTGARGGSRAVPLTPWWLLLFLGLAGMALAVVTNVAVARAAIYLKADAGLTLRGVRELMRCEPRGFRTASALTLAVTGLGLLLNAPVTYSRYFIQLSPFATNMLRYGVGFAVATLLAPAHLILAVVYGLWAQSTDISTWPPLQAAAHSPREGESAG